MMKINLNFLKPRLLNVLLTLVIFSLPVLQEKARLPEGGYEVAHYRPIFLLASYLQMQDWYPFFLVLGLLLFFYVFISFLILIFSFFWKKVARSIK